MTKHFKCAFCKFKVLKFRTIKGKTLHPDAAWEILHEHVVDEHPKKAKEMGIESKFLPRWK